MNTLEEKVSNIESAFPEMEAHRAAVAERKNITAGRLEWLQQQANGLRYQASKDAKAQTALEANQAEAEQVSSELEALKGQLADWNETIKVNREQVRALRLTIRKRDFHQKRLAMLEAWKAHYYHTDQAAKAQQEADRLHNEITQESRAFMAEGVKDCPTLALPPGPTEKKLAFMAAEIEQEKRVIAELSA